MPVLASRAGRIFGVPVATRATPPPSLDKEAEAAFVAKVKALVPKYRTELLLL
jgi:hypothetical protein